jgi:hypothetical protein
MDPAIASSKYSCIEAVVYPKCFCGEPWAAHGVCGGYKPLGPVIDYGTMSFESNDRIANMLFRIERFFKRLRVARLKRASWL